MDGIFGNLVNGLAEIWKSIGVAQKVSIILTGVATLGACAIVLYFGTRPDWQILYADLEPKAAAKVYDIVTAAGVPVKLSDSGKTIMVPSKDVYRLRLKVANEGIQTSIMGSGGWETFDKLPLGATDLQQQMAKQRALQGELEKMINEMPGVATSRVMLTLPQKGVFKKDKLRPSASITLNLDQGASLGSQIVNGIRCLVASSVSGMGPDDVTIVDNHGNLLAKQSSSEDPAGMESDRFMDMQTRTERLLKEKAEAILRPIVGTENVVAMVSCDMDFDSVDKLIEEYDPEKTVVVSEKKITEDMNKASGGGGNGGRVGISANNTAEVTTSVSNPGIVEESTAKEMKQIQETSYAVAKTVQKVSMKAGKIKNIAVAVTVKKPDGGAWTPEQTKEFENLVSAAVGAGIYQANAAAGAGAQLKPVVTVTQSDFYKVKETEIKVSFLDSLSANIEAIGNLPIVRPIFGLALLGTLFIVFKKYFKRTAEASEGAAMLGAVYSEDVKQLPAEVERHQTELGNVMDALQAKASASPQAVAALMENWMAQDQG